MTHACPLVMRVVPWREALGRGTSEPSREVSRPSESVDRVDRRPSKINESWVKFFSRQKSHVHVMGQNDPYDTRKPPEKFQGHPSR
ncbi:uncharacterized protein G2W53_040048 [Senna tora]|uniref:Uncharacterized protein n=1 Tax=Senna tora TaxID=362788 RepID=A0A834SUA2_9FABA|nr:uncharacterized protein G2W53_040048 [Senna tora]